MWLGFMLNSGRSKVFKAKALLIKFAKRDIQ